LVPVVQRGELSAPLLALEPSEVVIANRTPERARDMAEASSSSARCTASASAMCSATSFDIVIKRHLGRLSGELPAVPGSVIGRERFCYDMAYGKTDTPFMQWALNQVRRAHSRLGHAGLSAESFRVWRGVKPSTGVGVDRSQGAPRSAHRNELFRARWMDGHRVVEIPLGPRPPHGDRKSLRHLVGTRTDDMHSDDALLRSNSHQLHIQCAGLRVVTR